jgi:DNA-binding MarR family transcriptional regulator
MPADSKKLPGSLADQLGFLSAKAHLRLQELGNAALSPLGLNVKHYGLLTVIAEEGPISQSSLGEIMRIDRTTMVAFVDELERLGHVDRHRNPDDRRAYALAATASGRKVQKKAAALIKGVQDEVAAPLSDKERAELVRVLRLIIEAAPVPNE